MAGKKGAPSSRRWTDEEILDALEDWGKKYGRPPTWADWKQSTEEHPSAQTVRARCGTWGDGLLMAGFELPSSIRRVGKAAQARNKVPAALRLRQKGLSNSAIAAKLHMDKETVKRLIGPSPPRPRRPRTAEEKRQARIEALKKAVTKQ